MSVSETMLSLVKMYEDGDLGALEKINVELEKCLTSVINSLVKKFCIYYYSTLSDLYPYLEGSELDLSFLIRLNNLVNNPNADDEIYVEEKLNFIKENQLNLERVDKMFKHNKGLRSSSAFDSFLKAQ